MHSSIHIHANERTIETLLKFKTHADAENVLNFLGNKFQLIQTTVKLICSCELLEKINLFHHEIECASWIIRIIAFHDYRMFWRCRGCRAIGANIKPAILTMRSRMEWKKIVKDLHVKWVFFDAFATPLKFKHVAGIFPRYFKFPLSLAASIHR